MYKYINAFWGIKNIMMSKFNIQAKKVAERFGRYELNVYLCTRYEKVLRYILLFLLLCRAL